jgi:hypothetical protein
MEPQEKGSGAGEMAHGAPEIARDKASPSTKSRRHREALTARVLPDGRPVTVKGREAQTLRLLIRKGPAGFTSGEASPMGWARRTSHYVWKLRAAGFPVATTREEAPDGCRIGRYSLTAPVVILAGGYHD